MLGNAYDRLRNIRARANSTTSSASSSADSCEFIEGQTPAPMMPVVARSSVDSDEGHAPVLPPSYDEVVSDDAFVSPETAPISHKESYRTRKHRTGSRVLSMEYGMRSSKIYMRG